MAVITTVKDRISQLNQANFQILCDELLVKEGYLGIVSLGTKEGTEKTTPGTPDTYFCLGEGKYIFAEYTTQKNGLPAKIRADIDKCLDEEHTKIPLCDIIEIVYCHTSSNISPASDRELRSICEGKGIKLTLLGVDLLAEKLMNYPSIIKDILGLTIDSEQIQSIDDFKKQYNTNAMAATLETEFLFREKEIEALDKAFDDASVVLLVGPAGTGKTRLAIEYSQLHAEKYNERLLCIHDRSLPMYEDLKLYFEKPRDYFILVDDANQISELEHVVEYVNKTESGYNVHILMTVREYAVGKVKSDINGVIRYEVINVVPFSDEEISTLMEKHYNILNSHYLERIVQIAEGNARIAMLAGKIAYDANRLDAISDVSDLYEDYYGKVLRESEIEVNDELLVSAGIMAFLNAVHLDRIDSIVPILEEKGLSKEDFEKNIHTLHEYEIVDIYNDKGVRFSEQCMANFILKYVFFNKRSIKLSSMIEACFSAHHERTVHAVNTLIGVFRSSQIQAYVRDEILDLWEKLENEESPAFFKYLKTFYPVNELKTLLMLQEQIDAETPVNIRAEDINTKDGKNYQNISDDIIIILGGFSHSENLDSALDLFFQYYLKRPDLYMQFFHASTSYFSIDTHSAEYGYQTQIKFFQKILQYAKCGDDPFITKLFLDIASHFLSLEFSPAENTRNGKGLTLYRIPLSLSTGAEEYRKIIWEFLLELVPKEQYSPMIRSVLDSYGNVIHDCSKEVIESETEYICKLSNAILSTDSLEDCLIVNSIQKVFEAVEYQPIELQPFLNSSKYELYQIISGSKWDFEISYEEWKKKKGKNIRAYMAAATDKTDAFKDVLQLFVDSDAIKNRDSSEIADGVNIALRFLSDDREAYIDCVEKVLNSEIITGIRILDIVNTLFSILQPAEVYGLLANSHKKHRNVWMYSYFREIPQKYINQQEVVALYNFLLDESDRDIQTSPSRDIGFLDKYLPVDNDVILNASKIILKKKEYSPFVVTLYFELQFNEHNIQPKDVIQKFIRDIKLLESIYMCVVEYDNLADYQGLFLHELLTVDKSFVKEYTRWFVAREEKCISRDDDSRIYVFFQEDDYLNILDFIIDEAVSSYKFPSMTVPRIIKILFSSGNKKYNEKSDCWIKHFIENNYTDKKKMQYLFEALVEVSIERAYSYIPLLIAHTDDYDTFESIPLTPSSYSWTGSCVPMYSSLVEHLEKLLPIFSGLKYIKHKSRVQQSINSYRHRIKEEEISDILNG